MNDYIALNSNKNNIEEVGKEQKNYFFYDPENLKSKILDLLNIKERNYDKQENFIELFDIENDFNIDIRDFEDKTIYDFKLNKYGLEKVDKIKKYLSFKEILEGETNKNFEYKKTKTSIFRYNDSQENSSLKIDSIKNLEYRIIELENSISGDSKEKLSQLETNYFIEKEKEIKSNNQKKEFINILDVLNIDSEIEDFIKKYNLADKINNLLGLYKKSNIGYSLSISKAKEEKNYENNKEKINNKNVLESLLKNKGKIFFLIGIGALYGLINIGNGKNEENNITFLKENKEKQLQNEKILEENSNELNIGKHGKILEDSIIYSYLYFLEKDSKLKSNKGGIFMDYLEKYFLYHFRNINKINTNEDVYIKDLKVNFQLDKNLIKLDGYIILYDNKKYELSHSIIIEDDDYYSKILNSDEYCEYKTNYDIFNSFIKKEILDIASTIKNEKEIKKIFDNRFLNQLKDKNNFSGLININNINYIKIVSESSKIDDGKSRFKFSIIFGDKSYNYSFILNI